MGMLNIDWLNEQMLTLPNHSTFYNIICFLMGRRKKKFTYKEWYLMLRKLNEDKEGGDEFAFTQILRLYKANNGRMPQGLEDDDQ